MADRVVSIEVAGREYATWERVQVNLSEEEIAYIRDVEMRWRASISSVFGMPYTMVPDHYSPEAREISRKLLLEYLDKEQYEQFMSDGCFWVRARQYDYLITPETSGNVWQYSKQVFAICPPRRLAAYCLQLLGVPLYDQLLAQKLLLETNEAFFLRRANRL